MEGRKKSHDLEKPRITYHATGRTFDRLLKEDSLQETKDAIRLKLGLSSEAVIRLQQLRDGNAVDLDDDDDFEAFYSLAQMKKCVDVQVTVSQNDAPQTGSSKKRGRSKTPSRRLPKPIIDSSPLPDEDDDNIPASKKRKVTFEPNLPKPNTIDDLLRSETSIVNSGRIANVRASGESDSQSNLLSRESLSVGEPAETDAPQRGRKRSKSKTRRDSSRPPAPPQESPSSIEVTTLGPFVRDVEYIASDSERDPNRNLNISAAEKEVDGTSPSAPLADPVTSNPSRKRKSSRKHSGEDRETAGSHDGGTRSTAEQANAVNSVVVVRPVLVSHKRSSGKKRARRSKSEEDPILQEPSPNDEHVSAIDKKEKRVTAQDEELVKAAFSRVLAKYSNSFINKERDTVLIEQPQDSVSHAETSSQTSRAADTNSLGSEDSVLRTSSHQVVSHTSSGSTPPSLPFSALSKSQKSIKSTKPGQLPCPVCRKVPFHLRYRCPIVMAGPNAIRKRLQELKAKDKERHKDLIDELQRMIKSRDDTNEKCHKSNVNADSTSSPSVPERPTPSDTSDRVADKPLPKTVTSDEVDIPRKPGNTKESRDKGNSDSDSDRQSEVTIIQPSFTTRPLPALRSPLSCANVDLDEVVRGPPMSQRSIDNILDEFIDEEDINEDIEAQEVDLDEEDEGYDAKLRRLSKRFEKELPSSDSEESEEDIPVIDIEEITGAQSSGQTKYDSSTREDSDIEQTNDVTFPQELVTVLNAAADESEDDTRVALSIENEPNNVTPLPDGPGQLLQKGETEPLVTDPVTIEKLANNSTEMCKANSITQTTLLEVANHSPPVENSRLLEDDDPIEPAEDFPAVDDPPPSPKLQKPKTLVERMRTRNSSKKGRAASASASRSNTNQSGRKGGTRKIKAAPEDGAVSQNESQKPTATNPEPAVVVDDSTPGTTTGSGKSLSKGQSNRATNEKPDEKGRKLRSKAEVLAQAVAEKGGRRSARISARPVVLISPPPATLPPPPSLDKWTTLSSGIDDSSAVDQLHSSSSTEQNNQTSPANKTITPSANLYALDKQSNTAGAAADPLFLPSESQLDFPYSQWKDDASQKDAQAVGKGSCPPQRSGSESEEELQARKHIRRRSSVSYRSLSDIARQKKLFPVPVSTPTTQASQQSIGDRLSSMFGKHIQREGEEEDSETDSSEDDKSLHIPKARLAGATVRVQKPR